MASRVHPPGLRRSPGRRSSGVDRPAERQVRRSDLGGERAGRTIRVGRGRPPPSTRPACAHGGDRIRTPSPSDAPRLAVYGTLAPGRVNAHVLEGLAGRWSRGSVAGRLVEAGWGSAHGFPALILDDAAGEVEVAILESDALPDHWARLDAFEGDGYRRVVTTARTADGPVETMIYVLADTPPDSGADAGPRPVV